MKLDKLKVSDIWSYISPYYDPDAVRYAYHTISDDPFAWWHIVENCLSQRLDKFKS